MSSLLERIRHLHEESQVLERLITDELKYLQKQNLTYKQNLTSQIKIREWGTRIQQNQISIKGNENTQE